MCFHKDMQNTRGTGTGVPGCECRPQGEAQLALGTSGPLRACILHLRCLLVCILPLPVLPKEDMQPEPRGVHGDEVHEQFLMLPVDINYRPFACAVFAY